MDESDIPPLVTLRSHFEKIAGPPGLFHASRVRLDGQPIGDEGLAQGWDEFLGDEKPFAFSCEETRAGPGYEQCCFFGHHGKLSDFSALAVTAIGLLPLETVPILGHHSVPQQERHQWALCLYREAICQRYRIALDAVGQSTYARYGMDSADAASVLSGMKDQEALQRYLASLRRALRRRHRKLPRFLYAAIATDLAAASMAVIDRFVTELRDGLHQPAVGIVPPARIGFRHARPASEPSLPKQETTKAAAWPPDEGWHFESGKFAFMRVEGRIQGVKRRILEAFSRGRPLKPVALLKIIANDHDVEESTLRGHLTRLRTLLRQTFDLPDEYDPLPHVDTGEFAAWELATDFSSEVRAARQRRSSGDCKGRTAHKP